MRRHPKHARVDRSSPRAWGTSDRNGFISNLESLHWQYEWAGNKLVNKRILVSADELDIPQRQLGVNVIPPDPPPVLNARPEPYSIDEQDPALDYYYISQEGTPYYDATGGDYSSR